MSSIISKLVNVSGNVTGILPVANGGTGLSAGTSGGILGYTAPGTLASSAALTISQLIIGGGAGATPSTLAAGSQYQVLRMGATTPAYGSINLDQSAAVTGTLPVANGGTGVTSSTGTVAVVLSTSPTLVTPVLGVASCTSLSFANTADSSTLAYYSRATQASTFTFNGTGSPSPSGSITMVMERIGDFVHLYVPAVTATTVTSSKILSANSTIAAAYRPASVAADGYAIVIDNGTVSATIGQIEVGTNGTVKIYKDSIGTTSWTNAATCGLATAVSYVYYVGTGS